jgi:drug/metabolite transporter (DMT)-like permease
VHDIGTAGLAADNGNDDTPELIELAAASPRVKAKLYLRGIIAAVAAVVLWKGCSSILNNHIADDSLARELWYIALGFTAILAANSLIEVFDITLHCMAVICMDWVIERRFRTIAIARTSCTVL